MTGAKADVIVIGAGMVGICCASFLLRQGRKVTVIDRVAPGESCSFGNAGSLSWSSCVPISVPGLLPQVPGWLLDSNGPLTIRWKYLPGLIPWLWRYVRSGNRAQVEASAQALSNLHRPSLDLHRELAKDAGVSDLVRSTNYLHVYSSEKALADKSFTEGLRNRLSGIEAQVLNGDELRELEPQISRHYVKAVRIPDQGFAANPGRLVKSYAKHLTDNGGTIIEDEVKGLEVTGNRVSAVRTTSATLPTEDLVIAGGAWSHRLCEMLGFKVPLEAERGYHVTVANSGVSINGTIMETDGMFVATPMEMGVRFAGTVELATVDEEPNYERANSILRKAKRMFPDLRTDEHTRWMGRRPSLPDGVPVIGKAPRQENVFLAFGHAHTGMIGSPQSGRLIAGMVCKQPLNMDVEPFRVERFS